MNFRTLALFAVALLAPLGISRAADLTNGLMYAVPAVTGGPAIDGNLKDWDLSGAEPVWISAQTADKLHGNVAVMYDSKFLYVSARISLPGRTVSNPNNPVDAFWSGDSLEFRIAADPALPAPLDGSAQSKSSDRVGHITIWKNSVTNADYMAIGYGVRLDKGLAINPAASKVVITQQPNAYTIEARIPWDALHVPGGANPFPAGGRMTAVWGINWGQDGKTAALYRTNPGDFAFSHAETWGQVEFSPKGHLSARHKTMAEALAKPATKPIGVPITVNVPKSGKVTVNIFGARGEVLRELTAGTVHAKGPLTVYWDGHDQWGFPVSAGNYRWGAYISPGLKAQYRGVFGKSGTPPFQTADGRGGWIGDHSELSDVAADSTGYYAMCPVAEAEKSIIKLGYDDKTIWRRTPFVGNGWGPLYAMATNGKYLFASFGVKAPKLVRLDAVTGQTLVFKELGDNITLAPISDASGATVRSTSSPLELQPETSGLAASQTEVYAPVFSANIIQVLDAESGKPTRTLTCASPRGVTLDAHGNLYAVSFAENGVSKIVRFDGGHGDAKVVISSGLIDPWHVALDNAGRYFVTQAGASQQVAVFNSAGALTGHIGKLGGRTWAGTYRTDALRNPSGVAVDTQGRLIVAESAIPRVISRYTTTPVKLEKQWFGSGAYWNADIPDPDDPLLAYYPFEPTGFAQARITAWDKTGVPTASWDLERAGYDAFPDIYDRIASPEVKYLSNGRKYIYSDSRHGIAIFKGDQILPVGRAGVHSTWDKDNKTGHSYVTLWSDTNGNHKIDVGEESNIDSIGGQPLPNFIDTTASMWVADNGDLYLTTHGNKILRIPVSRIDANGTISWTAAKAAWCVSPVIASGLDFVPGGWRLGLLGVRVDSKGSLYTCYNSTVASLTDKLAASIAQKYPEVPRSDWQVWATPELAKANHEGLGHSGETNAVKFAKFDATGKLLWVAGRKATAAAAPGEMYHFWNLAGMVGEKYVAGGSEWGQMYLYTHDGFYVDALFNNPGLAPPPGPYTFGGETSGGRIQYFKKRGQVWAYCTGMAYLVQGFDKTGSVAGEQRVWGTVKLDHAYDTSVSVAETPRTLTIVPYSGPSTWTTAPVSALSRNGTALASAQVAYDATSLYARIHVADPSPLQNGAENETLAFKGGDAVGIDLGLIGERNTPAAGDIRVLAARIGGVDRLISMKPVSDVKRPQDYFTPAAGRKHFDYVGDITGGRVVFVTDKDGKGYTADVTIPRSSLGIDIVSGKSVKADIEVLLSGQGGRGLQATSRNYLFTPSRSETTMTDDIPTESWLYPQYWGIASVK
ncbi:MAG TPA: FlgD immunoglobulin-like domain containing protein [Capsulimonadaceae bacterium]|jgi:hypothetical protein